MLEEFKQQICRVDSELETLSSLAIQLGAEGVHPDLSTVVKIIEKALQDKSALELKAEAAGYKSADLALDALSDCKGLGNVPSDFTIAPSQWLVSLSANNIDGIDHVLLQALL